MNLCEDRHIPKYFVTYKPAKGGKYIPKWYVCESCMENRTCFGEKTDIESIQIVA